MGKTSKTRVQHRRRDLPLILWKNEDHRRNRRAGGDQEDPVSPRPAHKTTDVGGDNGYDAGKKVTGRKRHIFVDTLGLVLMAVVHSGAIQDRDGAKLVLQKVFEIFTETDVDLG